MGRVSRVGSNAVHSLSTRLERSSSTVALRETQRGRSLRVEREQDRRVITERVRRGCRLRINRPARESTLGDAVYEDVIELVAVGARSENVCWYVE